MHRLVKYLNEIPKDYKPKECKTCKIRIAYAKGMDWHFDFRDCVCECDVKQWEEENGK